MFFECYLYSRIILDETSSNVELWLSTFPEQGGNALIIYNLLDMIVTQWF